jgi:hypothetical protein
MNLVDKLAAAYRKELRVPEPRTLTGAERTWMLIYRPELERSVRPRLSLFEAETRDSGRTWALVDLTDSFEGWMARETNRERFFKDPPTMHARLRAFRQLVADQITARLVEGDEYSVVAVVGVGTLVGLVHISEVLPMVAEHVRGRLLVFFPGSYERGQEGNCYSLLDATKGWNYLATAITAA